MKVLHQYRVVTVIASALVVGAILIWAGARISTAPEGSGSNHLVLEFEAGAFLAETLEKSSYALPDLKLRSDGYTQVLLTPFENGRRRTPEIILRSDGMAQALPYVPARGDLYVEMGMAYELELGFYNFPVLRPSNTTDMRDSFDADILSTAEADVAPIMEIYETLHAFDWRKDQDAYCANQTAAMRRNRCLEADSFAQTAPSDQIEAALVAYVATLRTAFASNDLRQVNEVGELVIGQWMTDSDVRVRAVVRERFDISRASDKQPSERAVNLQLGLSLNGYLPSAANLMRRCHSELKTEGEILAPVRSYTPQQARIIYGGLLAELVSDPAKVAELTSAQGDWDGVVLRSLAKAIGDMSQEAREIARRDICPRLPELQTLAGWQDR